MKGTLRIARGTELKLTLPGPSIKEDPNGYLWFKGKPILGITDQAEIKRCADLVRAGKTSSIPAEHFTRLGDNPNGLWAGDDVAWQQHPAKIAADAADAARRAEEAKRVTIYLSSRGWGDYSPVEWHGDITRPDNDILEECQASLKSGHDVDQKNQDDAAIIAKIQQAREQWRSKPEREAAARQAEVDDMRRKIETGYCFNCESWCHGDCGHYSNDPMVKARRDFREATREQNYGIND